MTAASLLVPLSPPGASLPRPAQSNGASDVAGLFALLLAGVQPAQGSIMAGARPVQEHIATGTPASRAALPSALAGTGAPQTATASAMPMRAGMDAPEPATAATPDDAAALPAPRPAAVPVQARLGESRHVPRLDPTIEQIPSPEAGVARTGDQTRTAAAPPPMPHHRIDAIARAAVGALEPPPPATPADQPLPMRPSAGALTPHAATGQVAWLAPAADAPVPIAVDILPPQSAAPRRAAGASTVSARVPSITADGGTARPGSELARPNLSGLATMPASPGPAADQPTATDRARLEPAFEAFESALGRSEQSAPDAMRLAAPGRTSPPVPPPPVVQISLHIVKAVPAHIDRLFVQLEPAALGRVEVRLEFHRDNQVSAMIAAERPDTLDALQRDARLLERSLQDAGLRLDSDGLTFSLKREQADAGAHEHAAFALPGKDGEDPSLVTAHDDVPPLRSFGGLRLLDIRI
jgi:hypothetical protein